MYTYIHICTLYFTRKCVDSLSCYTSTPSSLPATHMTHCDTLRHTATHCNTCTLLHAQMYGPLLPPHLYSFIPPNTTANHTKTRFPNRFIFRSMCLVGARCGKRNLNAVWFVFERGECDLNVICVFRTFRIYERCCVCVCVCVCSCVCLAIFI